MNYAYLKALHLVGVVSWFAGLLYIVRLFVYHVEAQARNQTNVVDQLKIMERRLWYAITVPAMVITLGAGVAMAIEIRAWEQTWFLAKLGWLAGLFAFHFMCGYWRKLLAQVPAIHDSKYSAKYTSKYFRVQNEVATVLLVAIVFTAVVKDPLAGIWAVLGFLALAVCIVLGMRLSKKLR